MDEHEHEHPRTVRDPDREQIDPNLEAATARRRRQEAEVRAEPAAWLVGPDGRTGPPLNERPVAGIYTHLHEVWRLVPCELVGWMAFWGCVPRYLPRADIADCRDPEQWLDEEIWREYLGGSPDGYAIRAAEAVVEPQV
jgi:hypothetical protein